MQNKRKACAHNTVFNTYTCRMNDCVVGKPDGDGERLVVAQPASVGRYMRSGAL